MTTPATGPADGHRPARGDPQGSPRQRAKLLVDLTYPLLLECGRQIAPQSFTLECFESPEEREEADFVRQVVQEGRVLREGRP